MTSAGVTGRLGRGHALHRFNQSTGEFVCAIVTTDSVCECSKTTIYCSVCPDQQQTHKMQQYEKVNVLTILINHIVSFFIFVTLATF